MLNRVFATWVILMAFMTTASLADDRPINVGELPLMFVDDAGVAVASEVARTIHPATRRESPAMEPKERWEGTRLYLYGSIWPDEAGGWRMWYMSRANPTGGDYLLYATSKDGLAWDRPNLKQYDFKGSTDNNIIFGSVSPSVLYDTKEKDPAKRYKLLQGKREYNVFHSPDGITWTQYPEKEVFSGGDTHTLAQDPVTGEYLLYHKRDRNDRGRIRRTVFVSRSSDFVKWSSPKLAVKTDDEDDAWAKGEDEHTQVYSMSVFPHAGGFVGLPAFFRVTEVGNRTAGKSGHDGPLDVQMVTSPDGDTWSRTTPRLTVIPRGKDGDYDGGAILGVSNTMQHVGDQSWVYYTAMNTGHGAAAAEKKFTIGRAEWRRHGMASLDAGNKPAKVTTKPLQLTAGTLIVNADASKGQLRVSLLEADGKPIAGYAADECEVLKADQTQWAVKWAKNATVPTDRKVCVVIEMADAKLFSIAAK